MRTRGRLDTSGLRILFYHRVSDDRDELAVAPDRFAEQMDYLASEAYRVVDVLTAIDLLDSGKPLARTVAMTFDDGFLDVAEHALPILSERGFHATVFVSPAVTDGRASFSWYQRAAAAPGLGRHRRARPRRHAPLRGALADPSEPARARRRRGQRARSRLQAGAREPPRPRRCARSPIRPGSTASVSEDRRRGRLPDRRLVRARRQRPLDRSVRPPAPPGRRAGQPARLQGEARRGPRLLTPAPRALPAAPLQRRLAPSCRW